MDETLPSTFVAGFSDEEKVRKMQYNPLGNTGLKISKLTAGGGAFGGTHTYGDYEKEKAKETVIDAVRSGINFIDAGPHYGRGLTEIFLGSVLKQIPRNAYYISTKVGRCGIYFNFTSNAVRKSFEQSLKSLQLESVDIVFVHDVEFADSLDVILDEALPTVESFVKEKKARFIGICGYPLSTLKEVIEKSKVKIDCIISYCRDTLTDNTLQDFLPFLKEKGIGVINAGCIGMRLLSNMGPPTWHPASKSTKELCSAAGNYCKEKGVELGKLALYHSMNQPGSDTHLVGMNEPSILQMNLELLWNGLNESEQKIYEELKRKFFPADQKLHWEGVEIDMYRKNLFS